MAQAKVCIPPDTICAGCRKPKRDHGCVYKAACERFRTDDNYASVMDTCRTVIRYDPYKAPRDGDDPA